MEKYHWVIIILIAIIIFLLILNIYQFSVVDTSNLENITIPIRIVT